MLFCVPILGNTLGNETTYSEVLLDGEVIGAVADPEEVDQAFLNARAKIARETEGLVLANVECSFQRVSKLFGSTLKEEQLEQVIYDLLQEKVKDCKTEILHGEGQRIYHQSGEHGRGTAASGSSTDGK